VSVLRARVITAVTLGVLLIFAILYLPAPVTGGLMGATVLVGAWEWSAFLGVAVALRLLYVALIAALGALAWICAFDPTRFLWLMRFTALWWVGALVWLICAPRRVSGLGAAVAGVLALVPAWLALVRIDTLWEHGAQWVFFILLLTFSADTGAFFSGRHFGRVRLAAHVSPNKTWEGVLGGVLLALLVAVVANFWFQRPPVPFLSLCTAAAGFSVVGDLTESMLKRHVGLKDSGRLFPGHGGMLDRMDSVTAATPVMTLGLMWMGVGA
jgi:phosphatidate cytidylyltransferase